MAILTTTSSSSARHAPPTAASLSLTTSHLIAALHPALTQSLHFAAIFQRLLSSYTFFVSVQISLFAVYTTQLLLLNAYFASKVVLLNSYYVSSLLAWNGLLTTREMARRGWKALEPLRKKLFFEFMVWILNPYAVALFVFWPGWIVVGGVWFWCTCLG
jgi:hypothetical protein